VLITGVAVAAIGIYAKIGFSGDNNLPKNDPVAAAVQKGVKWLVSVQGKDGGWGQDGGETSYVRQGERLESNGNDVANTAVAAEALLHTGSTPTSGDYHEAIERAIGFILKNVEESPVEGLAVTNLTGTQIQRKLGPYIDTFLTSKLLAELDGNM
jgi:squalene cyclase